MGSDQIGYYIVLVVTVIGGIATVSQLVKARKDTAQKARDELVKAFADGKVEGRSSRDDEVALLRSQRDDARRDRDVAERDRDDARRDEADARRTLSMMQRPIADWRLDPAPPPQPPRPRPRETD